MQYTTSILLFFVLGCLINSIQSLSMRKIQGQRNRLRYLSSTRELLEEGERNRTSIYYGNNTINNNNNTMVISNHVNGTIRNYNFSNVSNTNNVFIQNNSLNINANITIINYYVQVQICNSSCNTYNIPFRSHSNITSSVKEEAKKVAPVNSTTYIIIVQQCCNNSCSQKCLEPCTKTPQPVPVPTTYVPITLNPSVPSNTNTIVVNKESSNAPISISALSISNNQAIEKNDIKIYSNTPTTTATTIKNAPVDSSTSATISTMSGSSQTTGVVSSVSSSQESAKAASTSSTSLTTSSNTNTDSTSTSSSPISLSNQSSSIVTSSSTTLPPVTTKSTNTASVYEISPAKSSVVSTGPSSATSTSTTSSSSNSQTSVSNKDSTTTITTTTGSTPAPTSVSSVKEDIKTVGTNNNSNKSNTATISSTLPASSTATSVKENANVVRSNTGSSTTSSNQNSASSKSNLCVPLPMAGDPVTSSSLTTTVVNGVYETAAVSKQSVTCSNGMYPVSVEFVGTFCINGPICVAQNSTGLCPGPQDGLPDGSVCGLVGPEQKVYGCKLPKPSSTQFSQCVNSVYGKYPVSVVGVGTFCVTGPNVCSGTTAPGTCPVAQAGLLNGSTCKVIPGTNVYGCFPITS